MNYNQMVMNCQEAFIIRFAREAQRKSRPRYRRRLSMFSTAKLADKRLDGGCDVVGIDTGGSEKLCGGRGAWHLCHGQLLDDRRGSSLTRKGLQNGVAEAAFGPVVFHHEDAVLRCGRSSLETSDIDRFD